MLISRELALTNYFPALPSPTSSTGESQYTDTNEESPPSKRLKLDVISALCMPETLNAKSEIPNGLQIYRNTISQSEHKSLLNYIDGKSWSDALQRRTQHYGARYNYNSRRLEHDDNIFPIHDSPFPDNKLIQQHFENGEVEQCIVNEYITNQCISAHTDALCFGPVVCTLSLGDSTTLVFSIPGQPKFELTLNAGDVVVLSKEARYKWKHETKPVGGSNYRRISVTYRTIQGKSKRKTPATTLTAVADILKDERKTPVDDNTCQ